MQAYSLQQLGHRKLSENVFVSQTGFREHVGVEVY